MSPAITVGDAVSNDIIALANALQSSGYNTAIYTAKKDSRLTQPYIYNIRDYEDNSENLLIYHLAVGCDLNNIIKTFKSRIIICYHNITPSEFYAPYDKIASKLCERGINETKSLAEKPIACIADSEYNKQCLIELGYKCPIYVVPILIPYSDYDGPYNMDLVRKYKDGNTNILFVGRIAPNKKIENLLSVFYYFNTFVNPESRLIIAGNYNENDKYYKQLRGYQHHLGLDNVVFTGHIPFGDILAYYRLSDLYLSLSEHEGFCVPLVEAMYFNKPIIAYDACAVGETLGNAGIEIVDNDPRKIAEVIYLVLNNSNIIDNLSSNSRAQLSKFDNSKVKNIFLSVISKYCNN